MSVRHVPGFQGISATRDGRILGKDGHIRQIKINKNGRRCVNVVRLNGRSTNAPCARLVCLAWHGLPKEPNMQAHHIDENPLNDSADNLMWLTPEEHAEIHGWKYGYMNSPSKAAQGEQQARPKRGKKSNKTRAVVMACRQASGKKADGKPDHWARYRQQCDVNDLCVQGLTAQQIALITGLDEVRVREICFWWHKTPTEPGCPRRDPLAGCLEMAWVKEHASEYRGTRTFRDAMEEQFGWRPGYFFAKTCIHKWGYSHA